GTWQRGAEELSAAVEVPAVPVGPTLVQRLAAYVPQLAEDARHLEGVARLDARFQYRPEAQQWDHDLRLHPKQGRLRHALVPLPLEDLEASAQVANGRIILEDLTARAGTARLRAAGARAALRADAETRGELTVADLTLTPDLFERLPPPLRKVHEDFAPAGPV